MPDVEDLCISAIDPVGGTAVIKVPNRVSAGHDPAARAPQATVEISEQPDDCRQNIQRRTAVHGPA